MTMEKAPLRIGEVIESSTLEFVAQCDALHTPPALGSVVVVREGNTETYALVSYAETASIDTGRRPVARGAGMASEEDVYRRHPELGQLLRTLFDAAIVAHRRSGRLHPYLPGHPPRVHAFVYPATPQEVALLAAQTDLLPAIAGARVDAGEEFVAASLRALAAAAPDPHAYLTEAGRRLVLLLRGDPTRLQSLLPKLRPPGE